MKTTSNKFNSWMNAITFAEAGEWETAENMAPVSLPSWAINQFQKIFMAAAFAEEGLHAEAVRLSEGPNLQARPDTSDDFLRSMGLGGIRMTYGVFATESTR